MHEMKGGATQGDGIGGERYGLQAVVENMKGAGADRFFPETEHGGQGGVGGVCRGRGEKMKGANGGKGAFSAGARGGESGIHIRGGEIIPAGLAGDRAAGMIDLS